MRWEPVTNGGFAAASLTLSALAGAIMLSNGPVAYLDHLNSLIHEAGHSIFRLFGETPGLFGGFLAQLLLPIILMGIFFNRGLAISFALSVIWLSEIGIQMSRSMFHEHFLLPVPAGDPHTDWPQILTQLDCVAEGFQIAAILKIASGVVYAWVWLWLFWRWYSEATG